MHKFATIFLLSATLLACHANTVEQNLSPTDREENGIDYTTNRYEATVILGETYSARYKTDYFVYLYNSKDEILLAEPEATSDISFKDFNGDNLDDFTIGYTGPSRHYRKLYLFDKEAKKFREAVGFEDYSEAERIGDTKYYYSYRQDGCANSYWTSDLFSIEDYKINRLGSIYVNECYGKDKNQITEQEFRDTYNIKISKFVDGKAILFEQLDTRIFNRNAKEFYKDTFLKKYWEKNYKAFTTENNSMDGQISFSGATSVPSSVCIPKIVDETKVELGVAAWSPQFTIRIPKFTGAEWRARQRNSRCYSLNDEGAHIDFTSWKNQLTDWKEMPKRDNAEWQNASFDTNDFGVIADISEEEVIIQLREEFKKSQSDTTRWVSISRGCVKNPQSCLKDCKSELQFYRQVGESKEDTKTIVLMIPMGC